MSAIDPTARIEPGAVTGQRVTIGPFCVIGPNVVIGDDCRLVAQVHVTGHTTIGSRTVIYPFASLGTPPQSIKYRGGPTRLNIGGDCDIRESVTMNTGTEEAGGVTEVGSGGFFMANSHVGHDCHVGSGVVLANCASLGGHCIVGDHVFMGGLSAAHQFTRIGMHAMIAGGTLLRADVIPFGLALGSIARLGGMNYVGMKRRDFPRESQQAVRKAHKMLFFGEGLFANRVATIQRELGSDPAVAEILKFIRGSSQRSLLQPGKHHQD
jgi:UDP-N-acetylglucosamine acyltransferase